MPFLISLVARLGIPERFQRLAAIGTAIVAFIALCGLVAGAWALVVRHHDKTVIANHDAVQAAKVTQTELDAEHAADANAVPRDQERAAQTQDLTNARDQAQRSNPDEAAKPAGPSTRAVLDGLRRQAAGNQHPTGK